MKYFGFIWKNVWRKKIRTILTILSVFVAFLLFAMLSAVGAAFTSGADVADADRLVVIDKISLINPLPVAYGNRIAATPGVQAVVSNSWFGGFYQEPRNTFGQFPTDPYGYFSMYPELKLPEAQLEAWAKDRQGAVIGREIAERFGFSIGDRVPLQSTIWPMMDGNRTWEFNIRGIFDTDDPRGSTLFMLFQEEYFEEARQYGKGTVGWYVIRTEPGANPVQVANAIDAQFANSRNQTETSTEAAFAQSFAKQFGNIALIVTLILGAVFFTLLLVSGNTMSQSVRERISELAVLKTVGFSDGSVLGIVLAESIVIMLIGGLLGLGVGWLVVQGAAQQFGSMLPGMFLSGKAILTAIGIMIGAGIIAGIFPALKAMHLSIIDALARA